jgi:hypothetical protein
MAANKVQLYDCEGETSVFVDAEITDSGDLLMSGQDVGKAPKEFWGDADYEYWVLVAAEHKDRVLLALLEKVYGGNQSAVSDFRAFLKEKGLPSSFHSWV